MKKILLLYKFEHHQGLVKRLSDEMERRGILIDVFCVSNYELYSKTNTNYGLIYTILYYFKSRNYHFMSILLSKLFEKLLFNKMASKYDSIDFHSYYPVFYSIARFCRKRRIQYDITFWGSDLLRATEETLNEIKVDLDGCHKIKVGMNLLNALSQKYNGKYDDKAFFVDFGNNNFELIDSLTTADVEEAQHELLPNYTDGIKIICGYNGITKQNHKFMIEAIARLSDDIKSKIHVILPMTYACDKQYREEIRACIEPTGIRFTLLEDYLDGPKISVLRKITDVVINIQDTDAFSFSLQEHIYCGSVMIIGEWLKYPEAKVANVYLVETTKNNLSHNIMSVIQSLQHYKEMSASNKEKIYSVFSWANMAEKWEYSYKN